MPNERVRTPDVSSLLVDPAIAEDGLRIINTFVISMLQQDHLEDLLWSIVDHAGSLLDFDDCVVYLLRDDVLVQEAGYARGNPDRREEHEEFALRLGEGVVGQVAQTGEARRVQDTRLDPDYTPDAFSGLSELAVPIVYRGRVIGVLDSESLHADAYDERDQAIFQSIANIASARIAGALAERERRATRRLLEEKNEELERFTYTVSHDLKSPLITTFGFLKLLERDLERGDMDRAAKDLERIRSMLGDMENLINDLLELSRLEFSPQNREEVRLDEVVRRAVEQVEGQIAARGVRVTILPGLPTVLADRGRILQVVQNLVSNAVKFLGDQPDPHIEIGVRNEEPRADLFVRDNGLGIPPERLESIFGLFDRIHSKIDGTGIGLALVRRVVEQYDGRVWAESDGPGRGSVFCLTLPHGRKPA